MIHAALFRRRILVVEDSFFLASHAADVLEEAGAQVVGPVPCIDQALELAASMPLDAAVYNCFLRSIRADRLADTLDRHGVPSVVLSLIGKDYSDPLLRDRDVIQWPFNPQHLLETVSIAIVRHRQSSSTH
ncbi:hypothetical protein [Roseomonas sp. 18066]|uniref:hypothetical protein n=1 Tax=Roseomonas sp. 18066 TaxID=2681412 RepID=UPI0013577563|nr:hypothetical protein [Roseomonas sp. 18066]